MHRVYERETVALAVGFVGKTLLIQVVRCSTQVSDGRTAHSLRITVNFVLLLSSYASEYGRLKRKSSSSAGHSRKRSNRLSHSSDRRRSPT